LYVIIHTSHPTTFIETADVDQQISLNFKVHFLVSEHAVVH